MKDFLNRLDSNKRTKIGEIARFGMVGTVASLIQYGMYLLLLRWTHATLANTAGYLVSLAFNFYASARFTFRVKANAKRGAGFLLSHVVNYVLQIVTLTFFIWVGVSKPLAPIPMFCVCVPVNFLLVRYFLKR